MDTNAIVREFILETCDYDKPLSLQDDIFESIRITGDDADDFIRQFADTFDVDMSDYLWYFHHEEEGGLDVGSLFFKTPNRRVSRIPITIKVLADSITSKNWAVQYPDHQIPNTRKDVIANWMLLTILPIMFLIWAYVF